MEGVMGDLLSTEGIAERLQVSVQTIRNWVKWKRIPVVRITQRTFRFDPKAVEAALNRPAPTSAKRSAKKSTKRKTK